MLHCLVFKVPLVALALASAEAILSQLLVFVNTFFLFLKKKFLTGSEAFPSHEHER